MANSDAEQQHPRWQQIWAESATPGFDKGFIAPVLQN